MTKVRVNQIPRVKVNIKANNAMPSINTLEGITQPADTDNFLVQSSSSFFKRISWNNLKALFGGAKSVNGVLPDGNGNVSLQMGDIVAQPTEGRDTLFLNAENSYVPIAIGSGGSAAWLYPSTLTSATNNAYKQLVYNAENSETILTVSATNGETTIGQWIFDQPIGVNAIPLGVWNVSAFRSISNAQGSSYIKAYILLYHADNTVTVAYTANGNEINDTTPTQSTPYEATVPQINCLPTDKLGIKLALVTDRNTETTLNLYIGDGHGFRFSTPLPLRHDQLRDLDGDLLHQHIDNDERYNGKIATGVPNSSPISGNDISTLNKVANLLDANVVKVIVDTASTTKTLSIISNNDIRLGTLTSLVVSSFPSTPFLASLAFSVGGTAITTSFPSGIKWQGADCGSGTFVPKTSKRYNIIFFDDSVNINGIVISV